MDGCRLCSELKSPSSAKTWNQPLFESHNFVAVPSIGALVEGWILLVPKRHFLSFGAVPDCLLEEMKEFKSFLCSALNECYGAVVAFEHGPSAASRTVGCGVDHAHLHLVPLEFDLAAAVSPFLPNDASWKSAEVEACQDAYDRGDDYLYLEQPIGKGRIVTHENFGSQLFRRAIAAETCVPDQYNWREHEQLSTVLATIQGLRAWPSIRVSDRCSDFALR